MPTYVYRCGECEHEFEHVEKITSRRRSRRCPVCAGRAERQISGGAGFLFKGEGFYVTDYRSEEYRKKAKAESGKDEPAAKEGGGEGGKSEAPAGQDAAGSKDAPKKPAGKKPKKKQG